MPLHNRPEFYPAGTHFALPQHLTWESVAAARREWEIEASHAPLACGPGVVAWGVPLLSNYSNA